MGKVYYNQADSRWASHPYPSQEFPCATIKSGGCGVTCAAMVVSSSKEIVRPDTMGDIARENGFRPNGGTAWGLFQYVSDRWGLETREVKSSYEALQACKDGYFVVILCSAGLWTTGGHYILAVGARGDQIEIYDTYLYANKFNSRGRQGKVSVEGNSCFVQIDTFKQNSEAHAFFAYKINSDAQPAPEPSAPALKYVNTQSKNLNVRNAPNGNVIGSLQKGTQVLVYEECNGWARIGDNKWVSSSYLADSVSSGNRTMHVINVSSYLNVRSAPSTNDSIISHLNNNTEVLVDGEQNGWYHITSPTNGWVSGNYLSDGGSSVPNINRGTVGQLKRFAKNTVIYETSNLSGKQWAYLPLTQVKILANINAGVDKVYVVKTGRVGYVNIGVYK